MSNSNINVYDLLDESGGDRPRSKAPKVQAAPKPKPAVAKPAVAEAPKEQKQAPQPKPAPAKAAAPAASSPAAAPAKKDNDAKPKPQGDAQKGNKNAGNDGAVRKAPAQQAQQPRQQQQDAVAAAAARGPAGEEISAEKPRTERRDRDHRTHDRPNPRGRQFDRRSGTGRPANENKKGGSGKGNWGVEGQETAPEGAQELTDGEKEDAAPAEAAAAETEAVPPKQPEKEQLLLDEYLAIKKNKTVSGVEAPKIRQAGEGVDQTAWANYAPISKEEAEAPAKKKKETKKEQTNGKEEKPAVGQFIKITMAPHESSDNRRGRGPRGPRDNRGPRGGGRQGPRGDRKPGNYNNNHKETEIDMSQFPSLGASAQPAAPAPAPVKA